MNRSGKGLLKLIGMVLAAIGFACIVLSFMDQLSVRKKKCHLCSRRPSEYDDYADVDA